ncbi:MAG: cell division protein FtsW [Ruminococcaceae bacterium]|nr:cell division protein FtsW [Oscillospiraceae bacterium]
MNNGELNRNQGNEKVKRVQKNALPKRKMIVQKVGGVDRPFLICVILLLCMGTLMVFSSSYPYAKENFGDSYRFAKMQVLFALVGLVVMSLITIFIDYHFIRKFTRIIFGVGIILLVLVLIVGSDAKGAVRWIQIGPISLQPSEIMKFAVVLLFADYADRYSQKLSQPDKIRENWQRIVGAIALLGLGVLCFFVVQNKVLGAIFLMLFIGVAAAFIIPMNIKETLPGLYYGVFPYVIVLVIIGVLMYLQPHLSGLIIIAGIIFCMMVIGGTKIGYLLCGIGAGVGGVLVLALSMSHSSGRLAVWKNPFDHLLEGGWQPAQSLYAIGSGGIFGVGFGNSRQKHLYLPEPQNDYIFSIWCEEMGFIGALFLIAVFIFFIYRGMVIGLRAPDKFSSMLVIGIIMHVGLQVILNIAVVTNTLPSTGISLPFFSYGGTSLIILLAEMGVVLSVSRMSQTEKT